MYAKRTLTCITKKTKKKSNYIIYKLISRSKLKKDSCGFNLLRFVGDLQ